MFDSIYTILSLALGFGILHALDADHVLTVTGIAARENQWQKILKYSSHWAIGHSLSLLSVGFAVFLLGVSFNSAFSHYAELIVAAILAIIGGRILAESIRQISGLKLPVEKSGSLSSRRALVVGGIHGLAGTASILALIPVAKITEPALAISYLLFFSLGVIFSMFVFGGMFRHAVIRVLLRYPQSAAILQAFIGCVAIIFSVWLVFSVFSAG